MRRTAAIVVLVECPHRQRAVRAQRNTMIDRLVSCEEADLCRAPDGAAFPVGCAVYPSLATALATPPVKP